MQQDCSNIVALKSKQHITNIAEKQSKIISTQQKCNANIISALYQHYISIIST
jgi:hypothetical protein